MGRKGLRGSYTVEAAFVLPFLFLLMLGFLQLAFSVHDRVVQKAVCYETALEAAYGGSINKNGWDGYLVRPQGKELEIYGKERAKAGIIGGKKQEIRVAYHGDEIQILAEGEVKMQAAAEQAGTANFLRKVRSVMKLAEEVKQEIILED